MIFFACFILIVSASAFSVKNVENGGGSNSRIAGGTDVTFGEAYSMISIQDGNFGFYQHICGGAIYNDYYVITSARCMETVNTTFPSYIRVVGGEHTLYSVEGYEQFIDVESVIVHEDYNPYSHENDISLLRLSQPFDFTGAYVLPANLPTDEEESTGYCTFYGWGQTSDGGSTASILQSVYIPVVTDTSCKDTYGTGDIFDSNLCAGSYGGECEGDFGGPLICQNAGGYYLGGIESWGYGCYKTGNPAIFTQISHFLSWITTNAV